MQPNIAVLLVNTGTPDSPQVSDVRRYLREFLGDKRVINLPWLTRKMLVNLIIAPFRGPKSAKLYEQIWTPEGSPLLVNSKKFTIAIQQALGSTYHVYTAMRYGNPSMESAVIEASGHGINQFILVPLYPQYADSTTGTIIAEFNRLIEKHNKSAEVTIIEPFFSDQDFIGAFAEKIKMHKPQEYEHVIFSFHGLPVKQTERMHPGLNCQEANCINEYNHVNERCYYASCYATARELSATIPLPDDGYTVSFQSRLGMNWLKPYTDDVLKEKAATGAKNMLIVSPAFVADCLETIYELGVEYNHLFKEHGGQELTMVESLNDDQRWVEAMKKMIISSSLK